MTESAIGETRRLVAVGYQGFGNIGDEAILTGIEAILADGRTTVRAIVCGPDADSVVGFPTARRIVSRRMLPSSAALRELWAGDGLLLSGGGLIHDHWPSVIPRYLAWIVLARALGKRVVWIGVGVGPISRPWQRMLARLARHLTTLALVRDSASADLLGGPGERVAVMPDPAVFNVRPAHRADPDGAHELAIIVRGPTPRHRRGADVLAAAVVGAYEAAPAHGWRPVLLTMAGAADDPFVSLLYQAAARRGLTIEITPLGSTPAAAMQRLARCGAVISVRLHGLILAALAGVPCVPVAYDAKVRAAADELGIGDLVVDQARVTVADLLERLERATGRERRERVDGRIREMRERLRGVADRVAAAMGSSR